MCTHDEAMMEERVAKQAEVLARLAVIDVKRKKEFKREVLVGAGMLWLMGLVVCLVGMYLLG